MGIFSENQDSFQVESLDKYKVESLPWPFAHYAQQIFVYLNKGEGYLAYLAEKYGIPRFNLPVKGPVLDVGFVYIRMGSSPNHQSRKVSVIYFELPGEVPSFKSFIFNPIFSGFNDTRGVTTINSLSSRLLYRPRLPVQELERSSQVSDSKQDLPATTTAGSESITTPVVDPVVLPASVVEQPDSFSIEKPPALL